MIKILRFFYIIRKALFTVFHLSFGDYLVVFVYLIVLLCIGYIYRSKKSDICDFFMAGRKLTLPVFVATLVSTFYGGVFGISEFVGAFGLGAWLTQGIFWYVVYFIFAVFCAERLQKMEIYTICDILEHYYGKRVAFVGGFFTYIMVNPAPYIFSLALILQLFFPISLWWAIILGTGITLIYTLVAGFRGVVYSDVFQCILMYLGFGSLFFMAVSYFGGWTFLQSNLSILPSLENHLSLKGGMSWGYLLVWAGMTCWIFVDPSVYQRCAATKSPKTARNGIFCSILLWGIFDIFSCFSALYAFASTNTFWFPNSGASLGFSAQSWNIGTCGILNFSNHSLAHIELANFLFSTPWKGFFLVAILATIMSTIDSYIFIAALNISRDYYWRFWNKKATDKQMIKVTRICILFTSLFSCILAGVLPSVVELWYTLGTIGLSALMIPVLGTYLNKAPHSLATLFSMLTGFLVALSSLVYHVYYDVYLFQIQPLYLGLCSSLIMYMFSYLVVQKMKLPSMKQIHHE